MNSIKVFEILHDFFDKDTSYVCSLGRTAELGFRFFPSQTLFIDCMGSIVPTAMGIALGIPDQVVVALDTDGSHLMGISILATISSIKEKLGNLIIVIIDNGIYESGGGLKSCYGTLDWELLGRAWALEISVIEDEQTLQHKLTNSTGFKYFVIKVNNNADNTSEKDIDGIESKYIFSRHLEKITGRKIIKPSTKN